MDDQSIIGQLERLCKLIGDRSLLDVLATLTITLLWTTFIGFVLLTVVLDADSALVGVIRIVVELSGATAIFLGMLAFIVKRSRGSTNPKAFPPTSTRW